MWPLQHSQTAQRQELQCSIDAQKVAAKQYLAVLTPASSPLGVQLVYFLEIQDTVAQQLGPWSRSSGLLCP